MQQFTVPQFIDVEDKIIGFITVRQFLILMSTFIILVIFYKLLDFTTFIFVAILIIGGGLVLAFVKINGRPFHFFLLNIVQTLKKPRKRVWNNMQNQTLYLDQTSFLSLKPSPAGAHPVSGAKISRPAKSRLAELSLIVDTKGSYRGEKNIENTQIGGINDFV